jgi:outer membrane receptor protein involved in Fe transport
MIQSERTRVAILALTVLGFSTHSATALAADTEPTELNTVAVVGTRVDLQGTANSASEGVVRAAQLQSRPLLRPGELIEAIPGMVATQHSGEGKANQYFLRGFNLDHGTDFATYYDGLPLNLPTHAHGQGYTDLNFIIPELIDKLTFRKGPYYAQEGDFSAVGSARLSSRHSIAKPFGLVELGQNGYRRVVLAASIPIAQNNLLVATEVLTDDGPWLVPQNARSKKLMLRNEGQFDWGTIQLGINAYQAHWTATDQIPQRFELKAPGNRFASLDPTTGGVTSHLSATAQWQLNLNQHEFLANAWWLRYRLNLFSNFTYATRGCTEEPLNPLCNSSTGLDQIEQTDSRVSYGFSGQWNYRTQLLNVPTKTTIGIEFRQHAIGEVGLHDSVARQRIATTVQDSADLNQFGVWSQLEMTWSPKFRTIGGLRIDQQRSIIRSPKNSQAGTQSIVSPKFSAIFSPNPSVDLYANWGRGFHSNDARINAEARLKQSLLVPAVGYEIGTRLRPADKLFMTAAAWSLKSKSELVFIGDAGTTEPSRPSKRNGIEFNVNWRPIKALEIDADLSRSKARFSDYDSQGQFIPGAMEKVASVGLSYATGLVTAGVRLRYFGGRALLESNDIRSKAATTLNAKIQYAGFKNTELSLSILNLTNRQFNDIEYAYASRLPFEAAFDEAGAQATKHGHPGLPRTVRIGVKLAF